MSIQQLLHIAGLEEIRFIAAGVGQGQSIGEVCAGALRGHRLSPALGTSTDVTLTAANCAGSGGVASELTMEIEHWQNPFSHLLIFAFLRMVYFFPLISG